ncbi:ABC transporter permease [Herpetosiphon geysericola]|uniref:ABC-2 type transporter transmembrane domain-containing protein n=1 Tax=Herpetosiphon geysericola TaxID=70996 RepID=A0A0P6XH70_9CHLR|nr:ABC transporter permease [Herpetosiphon geysericola]KPL79446.1 hypothetical protein SE18_26110 [Herpetosiphon geysericola]
MANKMLSVAQNEFIKHIRKPTFWLAVFGMPLLIAVVGFFSQSSNNNNRSGFAVPGLGDPAKINEDILSGKLKIGFVDESGVIKGIPSSFDPQTASLYIQYPDVAQGLAAMEKTDIPALYVIPSDYLATGKVQRYSNQVNPFGDSLQSSLVELLLSTSLYPDNGSSYAFLLQQPTTQLKVEGPDGPINKATNEGERMQSAFVLGMGLALLLYISIFSSANLLLQSLIEEKENRVIEVMLSSLRPRSLLQGKILGLGLLGLVQVAIWITMGAVITGQGAALGSMMANVEIPVSAWLLALLSFVLGYAMYASLMAGIGAVANTMRESSQLTVIVGLPIIIPLMFLSVIIEQPNGGLTTGLSLFPLTAPVVLTIRSVLTSVPLWQVGLSLGLMVLTVLGLQFVTARMFRASTLLRGSKASFGAMWQALRQGE